MAIAPLLKTKLVFLRKSTLSQPFILFRKITAKAIFTGEKFLSQDHVLLVDEYGKIAELRPKETGEADLEYFDGIICPGFINTHCHLELSHMEGRIPQHTGLVNFVQQVMGSRAADEAEKLSAMQQAEANMYREGIVAVADICNTTDSIQVKKQSKLYWKNFIEVSGFVDAGAAGRFAAAKKHSRSFCRSCRR